MRRNNSIEKTLPRLARLMILILIILILPANIGLQQYMQHQGQRESSEQIFAQLKQVIETNRVNLEQEKQDFSQKCIQAAGMAAYFVEHSPEVKGSLSKTRELAEQLRVDEIHFFTPEGEIYAGTHPKYYGYTFHSGIQMEYFLPMLEDTSMKLCQEITPNTAEGKKMQYAAVWMADESGIVQIGMKPDRILQEIKDTSLEKVISALPMDNSGQLHIVEKDTGTMVASTSDQIAGNQFSFFTDCSVKDDIHIHHYKYQGKWYCVYMEGYREYILIRSFLSVNLIKNTLISTVLVLVYLTMVALVAISVIVWYVSRKISGNLTAIVTDLKKIECGNLENITMKTNIQEFDQLILYINELLKSIRLNWSKLSNVIDKGRIPIGIFENNHFYKKAFINEQLLKILGMQELSAEPISSLAGAVEKTLEDMEAYCVDEREFVYEYHKKDTIVYLRVEKLCDEQSTTYYVTDVSQWWKEINVLREKSNRDILTGLYNRRGLNENLKLLFEDPQKIHKGAFLMLDADGLKKINDLYGHPTGDEYLCRIGRIIEAAADGHAFCARLGGDEFALFLYGYESEEEISKVIARLESRRGERFAKENVGVIATVEFSIGYAFYPRDGKNYHVLMHIADEIMYQEKKKRKQQSR